jgi:hypothetical protein
LVCEPNINAVWIAAIGACASVLLSLIAAAVSIFNARKLKAIENGMKAQAWHAGRDSMRIESEVQREKEKEMQDPHKD